VGGGQRSDIDSHNKAILGGWVNPHREQETITQGQTSSPPNFFFTPTAKARLDQAALATSAEARGEVCLK